MIIGARGAITFGGTEALLFSSNAPVGFMKAVGRTAGGYTVVVFSPFFDQDLSFSQAVEDFAIQELIPEPSVEAFTVSVLPG